MKPDYEFIIKKFPDRPNITIYPITDLHVGALEFMADEWERFKKRVLSEPNSYITIGGDMINNTTRSSVANIFEETMRPSDQKKWLVKELEPLRDKILCITPGNHERRAEKDADDNPLYDVAAKMDLEDIYRQNMAFIKIQMGDNQKGNGSFNPTYMIGVIHGAGGGIYTGAAVNRNERFAYVFDGIDALIVGHTHKGHITKPKRIKLDVTRNEAMPRQLIVIGAVSWLEYGGYAMQKMLLPAGGEVQSIELAGKEKRMKAIW